MSYGRAVHIIGICDRRCGDLALSALGYADSSVAHKYRAQIKSLCHLPSVGCANVVLIYSVYMVVIKLRLSVTIIVHVYKHALGYRVADEFYGSAIVALHRNRLFGVYTLEGYLSVKRSVPTSVDLNSALVDYTAGVSSLLLCHNAKVCVKRTFKHITAVKLDPEMRERRYVAFDIKARHRRFALKGKVYVSACSCSFRVSCVFLVPSARKLYRAIIIRYKHFLTSHSLYVIYYNVNCSLKSDIRRIYAQIVIRYVVPVFVGIIFIISSS